MKGAAIVLAFVGALLLGLAIMAVRSADKKRSDVKEAIIVTHALTEWKLARQHLERTEIAAR